MKIWVVTEGIAGTENQCLGVAEALLNNENGDTVIKRIQLSQPWKTLSPFLGFETKHTFSTKGDSLEPPFPDIALCAGRKAIAAARYIKRESKGKTFVVQIQDPRTSVQQFDLVAVPFHDQARGDNVIVTNAAPNRITDTKLNEAQKTFSDMLAPLPSPRVAVLIGGNSKAHTLTEEKMKHFTKQLKQLANKEKISFMVTTSRRTGQKNESILRDLLKDTNALIWNGNGENPYFGFLAYADYIIVSSDSVSMISDAATTGKPVYILELDGGTKKFDKFYQNLMNKNCIKPFTGKLEKWDYSPLNDSQMIASTIKDRLYKHKENKEV